MARAPGIDVIPAQDSVQTMFCDGRRSLGQFQDTLRRTIPQDDASKPADEYNDIVRAIHGYQLSDGDLENLRNSSESFKTKVEKVDTELLKALQTSSRDIGYQHALTTSCQCMGELISSVPKIMSEKSDSAMPTFGYWFRLNGTSVMTSHEFEIRPIGSQNQLLVDYLRVGPDGDCGAIAFITAEFANGRTGSGSGAFIGPDLVLTAAHNVYLAPVYDRSNREVVIPAAHARHILVQRGRWGGNPHGGHDFEERVGTLAVMNAAFIAHHVSNYDFAIIKLATAVNSHIEILSYQDYPPLSPGRQLRTVGFPGDLPNQFNLGIHWQHPDDGYYPYESVGKELRASTEHVLRHSMQTAPGNSGGPIFLHSHDEVVAVHCAGVPKRDYNEASYIGRDGNNIEAYKSILDLAAQAADPRGIVVIEHSVN